MPFCWGAMFGMEKVAEKAAHIGAEARDALRNDIPKVDLMLYEYGQAVLATISDSFYSPRDLRLMAMEVVAEYIESENIEPGHEDFTWKNGQAFPSMVTLDNCESGVVRLVCQQYATVGDELSVMKAMSQVLRDLDEHPKVLFAMRSQWAELLRNTGEVANAEHVREKNELTEEQRATWRSVQTRFSPHLRVLSHNLGLKYVSMHIHQHAERLISAARQHGKKEGSPSISQFESTVNHFEEKAKERKESFQVVKSVESKTSWSSFQGRCTRTNEIAMSNPDNKNDAAPTDDAATSDSREPRSDGIGMSSRTSKSRESGSDGAESIPNVVLEMGRDFNDSVLLKAYR